LFRCFCYTHRYIGLYSPSHARQRSPTNGVSIDTRFIYPLSFKSISLEQGQPEHVKYSVGEHSSASPSTVTVYRYTGALKMTNMKLQACRKENTVLTEIHYVAVCNFWLLLFS